MSTPQPARIYSAITAVMRDVGAIGKDRHNQQQGFRFRGIDDVYNALHPLLAKHGVFSTTEVLDERREERTNAKGTVLAFVILRIRYTFHAEDGSSVACVVVGEGMDSGDKATNKAMAIAHKYCLLQLFAIPTEESADPDAESHTVTPRPPAQPPPPPEEALTPDERDFRADIMDRVSTCRSAPDFVAMWGLLYGELVKAGHDAKSPRVTWVKSAIEKACKAATGDWMPKPPKPTTKTEGAAS